MNRKLKLLLLTKDLPSGQINGRILYTQNIIKLLKRFYDIEILAFYGKAEKIKEAKKNLGVNKISIIYDSRNHANTMQFLFGLLWGKTTYEAKTYKYNLVKSLAKIIREANPNILLFDHIFTAWTVTKLNSLILNIPCIYIAHNAEYASNLSIKKNFPSSIFMNVNYMFLLPRIKKLEKKILSNVNGVLSISEEDIKRLKNLYCNDIHAIAIPPTIDFIRGKGNNNVAYKSKILLLIGSFEWYPKYLSGIWLLTDIFPKVRAKMSDCELLVIGRKAEQLKKRLKDLANITILGTVDNVDKYYRQDAIFLVPDRQVGGVKLKTLQAACNALPIVSTTPGIDGTFLKDKESCLVADQSDRFSTAILNLLKNQHLRAQLGKNAYDLVKEKFSSSKISPALYDFIEKIA